MAPHDYPRGCFFETLESIRAKRITVMGLGLNGGGLAAALFFLRHGAVVTVTDMKTREQLSQSIAALEDDASFDHARLSFKLAGHDLADFENADCIIKNPGVKFEGNKFLQAAVAKGRAIETDLSVFLHFCRSPIIAVTGSKGKSSTVSAIYHGLLECGQTAFLGGNITVSPLTFLDQTNETTPVVLELSSWQLADLRGRGALKPKISVITKIVPDHLNWYGNMSDYVADKKLIYADQDKNDFAVFDFSPAEKEFSPEGCSSWGKVFAAEAQAQVVNVSDLNINISGLKVPGEHNKTNALTAAAVLCLLGIEKTRAEQAVSSWQGLEHRLQFFHESKNIRFYNDSAATVPEAAAAAIEAFAEPLVFVTGGTDKGLSQKPLAEAIANAKNIERLYLLAGSGTDKLLSLLAEAGVQHDAPFGSLRTLLETLSRDSVLTQPRELAVVFSPGATSFGMFQNEFDRGRKFMQAVREIFAGQ